jgi:hypothetical protein
LPTSFREGELHARFVPETPGEYVVQVVADTSAGLRPVLEAAVFCDVAPSRSGHDDGVPGETDGDIATADGRDAAAAFGRAADLTALTRWLRAARASMALPPLQRDPELDAIARQHALRIATAHRLEHDAGDGDPVARLRSAGLEPRASGENVAHAPNVLLAQREIWASPSHRANVLRREFDHVGVGVARDDRGEAWVVELFAGL